MSSEDIDEFHANDVKVEILSPSEVDCKMPKPVEKRIGTRMLTKFERIRVIGHRAQEIAMGGKVKDEFGCAMNPYETAELELKQKKIDLVIRRFFPDGSYEDWRVDELIIP